MKKRLLERLLELAIPIPSRPSKRCWPQRIILRRSDTDNYGLADASQGFVQEFWLYPAANRLFYCDYLTQNGEQFKVLVAIYFSFIIIILCYLEQMYEKYFCL